MNMTLNNLQRLICYKTQTNIVTKLKIDKHINEIIKKTSLHYI